ncbi:MAG: response regulator [Terriglobales bacterium]
MARKILLADDSVTAQNMGRKILADAGYDVVTVNNGSAALKRITELKPDLIVLDVYMPGYSGLEVCQRLKDSAETAHIPVLLTVGKLEPFKAEEARRVSADAHIVKPFEASELLTAITRLEDRMVPQQSEGARFSTSVSGVERFGGEGSGRKAESNADADTGWKSRLRFPSKKKKEEPKPEDVAAGATFRDFRKAKGKTGASAPFTVKAPPPPGQEPGLVPDIPRDITPEELDALSALAAKLDGPIPVAENIAPLAEKMGPAEAPATEFAAAKTEVEVPAAAAEAKKEVETPAPVVEPAAAAVEAPALAAEAKVEAETEVEIPVEHVEPAAEGAAVVADPAAVEIHQHATERPETQHPETPAAVVAVAVNTALLAQEPAPVDRNDEPMFASAASAVEQAAEDKAGEEIEGKPAEAVANSEATEASAPAEADAAKGLESKPEESKAEESRAEELKAENAAQAVPVASSVPAPAETEEPAPSDAELAEALRLLTPCTGHADVSTVPSHGTLVAAGQLLAEEAARNAAAAPRWVAEPVAVSAEEAVISLEAEMFRTFATTPAAAPGGEIEPSRITGVSAIAAAVENRLAAAEMAASAKALAEQGAERCSAITAAETAVEAPAEVMTPASNAASPVVDDIAPEKIEPEKIETEQKDSPAKAVEEVPAGEVAAATFADAVGEDEVEAPAEQSGEPVSGTTAAVAEENRDSSSDSGSRESMGKDVKAKSGKSNWHQIHTASASAAASSDVETAKQAEHGAEQAPKAMAAAAADGSAPASVPDASTIASIVDSVLADLRPKIVEEIARKLAGK